MTSLTAPADPRLDWDLPPFGGLPPVASLDGRVTRVLAPNPSAMTLDGTNTYVIAEPGTGGAFVVDPGPEDDAHLAHVRDVLAGLDLGVDLVLVTHHHRDHSAAAQTWGTVLGCRVAAASPEIAGPGGVVLEDGGALSLPGTREDVTVVATPGHTSDHVSFRLPDGSVLTGDHVLGRGTSVVAHPDGDLVAYLDSLGRLLDIAPRALYPGHGPELVAGDPTAVLTYYRAHREYRAAQVLAALTDGPRDAPSLVRDIYAEVDERLWGAAEMSTRATLEKLVADGAVAWDGDEARRLD